MTGPLAGRIAFVLKGYPRLSETFIAQEIAALERRGLDILIVSLRHPTDARRHPVHEEIKAALLYLPEYLLLEPWRVFRAWLRQRKTSSYKSTRSAWLRDLVRDTLLAANSACREYFDPQAVEEIVTLQERGRFRGHQEVWSLLVFESWHKKFIQDFVPAHAQSQSNVELDVVAGGGA